MKNAARTQRRAAQKEQKKLEKTQPNKTTNKIIGGAVITFGLVAGLMIASGGVRSTTTAAPVGPLPTVEKFNAMVLQFAGEQIVPDGYSLAVTTCSGIEWWVPTARVGEVTLGYDQFGERVQTVEYLPHKTILAEQRACDINGDNVLNGLDIQAYINIAIQEDPPT